MQRPVLLSVPLASDVVVATSGPLRWCLQNRAEQEKLRDGLMPMIRDGCKGTVPEVPVHDVGVVASVPVDDKLGFTPSQESGFLQSLLR